MSSDQISSEVFDQSFDGSEGFETVSEARCKMSDFSDAMELLSELSQAGLDDICGTLQDSVDLLGKLADGVELAISDFNDDDPELLETIDFVVSSCDAIRKAAFADDAQSMDSSQLDVLREEIELRLGAHHTMVASELDHGDWDEDDSPPESDVIAPSQAEIAALLSGLSAQQAEASAQDNSSETAKPTVSVVANGRVGATEIATPLMDSVNLDAEIQEAFMDDASRGLESMEQALLDLESGASHQNPVEAIGRELHTIKGASASIGMSHLAGYIHDVEELIREREEAGEPITAELLLPHVDLIRARVDGETGVALVSEARLPSQTESKTLAAPNDIASSVVSKPISSKPISSKPSPTNPSPANPSPTGQAVARVAAKPSSVSEGHADDETVRVKASQLNRLMDMLSELVMLRNQRDTELGELKSIHDELVHSVTRIRMLSHEGEALLANESLTDPVLAEDGVSFSHLNEVASDVMESAQRLRDCYRPVADGNQAVSQFIRNFRLELVQLRRMPASGLFRRLHRAISDAARTEQKQVRVELSGEDTGIERSLQERIFEPLLHIVRNSVSHGIENANDRVASGKEAAGIVTLRAHSGPDLLVIEVNDDGRGLDYDAIRRRGIQRGLIEADKSISRAELARLIFHPGFSTRETANQISGRGVGMDVVASTLERMRGWVEVESETGCGSTIRLSLPLPSMIQHAMVFESGGQLFALPAQSVRRTGAFDPKLAPVDLNRMLGLSHPNPSNEPSGHAMIELATGAATIEGESGSDFALMVDRVLGPEEVVVRPMPPMLKSHPLCTGATLSGMGEVVLLLDPRELAETSKNQHQVFQPTRHQERVIEKSHAKVLVVDDSKSARLKVVRALEKYPVTVVQVDDGQAAIELLAREKFATVFSDIDMPRVSGLDLLQTIKNEPKLESIPVVMISSRSVETAGKQARKIGATDYLQKPLTEERFDEAVRELPWAVPSTNT